MSRKSKSFSQLYDYLTREKNSFSFTRNTYSNSKNKDDLIKEFIKNSRHLNNARGKNYLYHELLSLEENNLSLKRQKEILLDLANKYLSVRADKHLAFGVVHEDKEHIHLHLMISANEIEGNKRIRISKKEFATIQKHLETHKNGKYKDLGRTKIYQNSKDLSKEKQNEQELKQRTKVKTKKEQIKEDLEEAFKKAASKTSLNNHLKTKGYEIYSRGKTIGVRYENKNYRLKTLGLDNLYSSKFKELERREQRDLRRERQKEDRSYSKEYFRERWKEKLNEVTKRKSSKNQRRRTNQKWAK